LAKRSGAGESLAKAGALRAKRLVLHGLQEPQVTTVCRVGAQRDLPKLRYPFHTTEQERGMSFYQLETGHAKPNELFRQAERSRVWGEGAFGCGLTCGRGDRYPGWQWPGTGRADVGEKQTKPFTVAFGLRH